jgi:Uma2 family endonuclease
MITILSESDQVQVPTWVVDLESFRRWADADDFPEKGRIWFLKGEVWVDMSKEQVFTHVLVKTKIAYTLTGLAEAGQLGMYLVDGALLSSELADISGKPDGIFIANATRQSGRIRLVEGMEEGSAEVEGSPDMVLEVVSRSSVKKDKVILRQAYWEAGVREYWLVDARQEPLAFDILRHTARGYTATRKPEGWVKSAVFGKAFRLVVRTNSVGDPDYTLEVR